MLDIEYLEAKNGEKIVKIDNYLMHSKYNPSAEAEDFVNKFFKPGKVQILYGVGMGHIVNNLIKKRKNDEKILIIDPIIKYETKESNVFFCEFNTENDLKLFFDNLIKAVDTVNVLTSTNYEKVNSEKYRDFLNVLNRKLQFSEVDKNTLLAFSNQWQENYIKNIEYIVKDNSLIKLKDMYDVPVVIASGGPSLTKQIPLLKEIREKVLLISSGSTINTLLNYDIEPDFVVTIDGGEANYNHFKDLKLEKSKIMYSMHSHPGIRKSFIKSGYYFLPMNIALSTTHLSEISKEDAVAAPGGGSVANYAFSIATFISTGPIALIGQDLAYTDNLTHAEFNKHSKKIDTELINSTRTFMVDGYNGNQVLSNYVFETMKIAFENMAEIVHNSRSIFNCTEGGALIKYFTNISFEEFCSEYVKGVVEVEGNSGNFSVNTQEEKEKHLINKLKIEISVYKELEDLLRNNIKLLKQNKLSTQFEPKIISRIERNDKKIRKKIQITCAETGIRAVNLEVLKYFKEQKDETPEQAYIRVYKQSYYLYKKMSEIINQSRIIMEEVVENLIGNRGKYDGWNNYWNNA